MSELKLLIDYTSLFLARENDHEVIQEHLMNFLKRALSIGCALDETQAVRQNEHQELDFFCGKSVFTGKQCDSKNDCMLPNCRTFKKKDS